MKIELDSVRKDIGLSFVSDLARTRGKLYVASWAHRITGVLLVVYIWFHTITMSTLKDPTAFQAKMDLFSGFLPMVFEWLLAVPVIYHALNGGRLILYELFGDRNSATALKWVLQLSAFYVVLFGLFLTLGDQAVSALFFWAYTAIASGVLVFLAVKRMANSRASFGWKLQRITGAFLFLMIPAHLLFMHLNPSVGRDAAVIISRMDSGFIKLIDLLLVGAAIYHGAYGLIGICRDYLASRTVILGCRIGIIAVSVYFAWIGMKMIVLV